MSENEYKLYDTMEKDHWWFKARRNILAVFLNNIEKIEKKQSWKLAVVLEAISYIYFKTLKELA